MTRVQVAYTLLGLVCILAACAHAPVADRDHVRFPLRHIPEPGHVYACALLNEEFTCVPMREFMEALDEARARATPTEEL